MWSFYRTAGKMVVRPHHFISFLPCLEDAGRERSSANADTHFFLVPGHQACITSSPCPYTTDKKDAVAENQEGVRSGIHKLPDEIKPGKSIKYCKGNSWFPEMKSLCNAEI